MTTGLATADYIILAGFFVVMLGVGVFYAGRMHNLRDFFSGSRQVPWWLAGISLYMTTFSAFTFVSYSALAYQHGFVAVAIWWFSIPGCLLSAWFLASRWRRAATTSPVEYLETRFGPVLRQAFSWFGIPLIVLDDALKLFVIGTMVAVSTGFENTLWAIAACGLIMLTYTLLGGLWAVLITDFVQFIVMGIAVIVLLPLAWSRAGGAHNITEHLPTGFGDITAGTYTWPWLLSFAVILALTFATKWPYVQRYYAARSDREARWVGYLVAALTFVTPPLLFFPALAARSFLPEVADANQVYPLVCQALLPVGMMGIMLAAMFSATMSMLSSDYNAVASVITNDILKRLFMRDASDKALVITARLATLFVGLLAMIIAIIFAEAKGREDLVQYMAGLFAALLPPVALPAMAGLLSRRTSNAGALAGFTLGAVCGVAAYSASYFTLEAPLQEFRSWIYQTLPMLPRNLLPESSVELRSVSYLTWFTLLPTAAGLIFGSLLLPNSEAKQAIVAQFLAGLRAPRGEKVSLVATGDAAVALRIIGSTIALMGIILLVGVLATASVSAATVSIVVSAIMIAGGLAAVAAARALARRAENAP